MSALCDIRAWHTLTFGFVAIATFAQGSLLQTAHSTAVRMSSRWEDPQLKALAAENASLRRRLARAECALSDALATIRLLRLGRQADQAGRSAAAAPPPARKANSGRAVGNIQRSAAIARERALRSQVSALSIALRGRTLESASAPSRSLAAHSRVGTQGHSLPFLAACANDDGYLRYLHAEGFDLDATASDGVAPLWAAACLGHLRVVERLCDLSAALDTPGSDGSSPLCVASDVGHASVARHLCSARARVDFARQDGMTPLCLAALSGHAGVTEVLCAAGASRSASRRDGATPMWFASLMGHVDVVRHLCNLPRGVSSPPQARRAAPVTLLVNASIIGGMAPLHASALCGRIGLARALLDWSANVDCVVHPTGVPKDSKSQAKKDYGLSDTAPLQIAIYMQHLGVATLLCKARANPDIHARTFRIGFSNAPPLNLAASRGHSRLLELLFACRARMDLHADVGLTAMRCAAGTGHTAVVRLLLRNSADVDERSSDGVTLVHTAALCGHAATIGVLCSARADPTRAANDGASPLHSAAASGKVAVLQALCSARADVHVFKRNGATPLHVAAWAGHLSVAQCLIAWGANAEVMMSSHLTPRGLALERGHMQIARALRCPARIDCPPSTCRTNVSRVRDHPHTCYMSIYTRKELRLDISPAVPKLSLHSRAL